MNLNNTHKILAVVALTAALGTVAATTQSGAATQSGPLGMMGFGRSAGYGAMMGVNSMMVSSELEYLTTMIPHHEEAIAAARVLLAGATRPELRTLARSIIDSQTREVSELRAWLAAWYPKATTGVTYQPMMRDLKGLSGAALEQAFLEDMPAHHMGAIMMSMSLVNHGLVQHQPMVAFARGVVNAQATEVREMRAWSRQWYGAANTGSDQKGPAGDQNDMMGGAQGGMMDGDLNDMMGGDENDMMGGSAQNGQGFGRGGMMGNGQGGGQGGMMGGGQGQGNGQGGTMGGWGR